MQHATHTITPFDQGRFDFAQDALAGRPGEALGLLDGGTLAAFPPMPWPQYVEGYAWQARMLWGDAWEEQCHAIAEISGAIGELCDVCGEPADGPGDAERVMCDCGVIVCSCCCVSRDGESYCPACGDKAEESR